MLSDEAVREVKDLGTVGDSFLELKDWANFVRERRHGQFSAHRRAMLQERSHPVAVVNALDGKFLKGRRLFAEVTSPALGNSGQDLMALWHAASSRVIDAGIDDLNLGDVLKLLTRSLGALTHSFVRWRAQPEGLETRSLEDVSHRVLAQPERMPKKGGVHSETPWPQEPCQHSLTAHALSHLPRSSVPG